MAPKRKNQQQAGPSGKKPKTSKSPELMSDKHKGFITSNLDTLAENFTADAMLNKLVADNIIGTDQLEELVNEKVSTKRAGTLLRLLLKKEDRTFYILIEACKKYNMPAIAKLLEDADNEVLEEAEDSEEDGEDETGAEDVVVVSYKGKKYEVDQENDGRILMSTLQQALERGYTVRGLQYPNPLTGIPRLMRLVGGKFSPPKTGWGTTVYTVLADQEKGNADQNKKKETKQEEEQEENDDEHVPMTDAHKNALTNKRTILINSMSVITVMDHLRSQGILNLREYREIEAKQEEYAQTAALVDLLLRGKGDDAFEGLVTALRAAKQFFLVRELRK